MSSPATLSSPSTDQDENDRGDSLRCLPPKTRKRSLRKRNSIKRYQDDGSVGRTSSSTVSRVKGPREAEMQCSSDDAELEENQVKVMASDFHRLEDVDVAGRSMFGFNTPKKRDGMLLAALNTPKIAQTPKTPSSQAKRTPSRTHAALTKTPSHLRHKIKNHIAKMVGTDSEDDFSADDSEYDPSDLEASSQSSSSNSSCNEVSLASSEGDEGHGTRARTAGRRPVIVAILPQTPSAARQRQSARLKKMTTNEFVPQSDGYFQTHASSSAKATTSDHTLDRLKNPRLPADRLFSLLADMRLTDEHEQSIQAIVAEYRTYFSKWLYILGEGYSLLLYGLGSKRDLLQRFHRELLQQQTVLVVNGFFPSLTIKDVLDSITSEILDIGTAPAQPHEAVNLIEEELALIPHIHLYVIVHNIDGAMLRNDKAQATLARLASIRNVHLLATIDHINTPLLWNQTKLSNFNFSWWDCTTMLPYSVETAFENSLLVQNRGELALSSLRSVFSSLTTNSQGIFMVIVKYQLHNGTVSNYQGMLFKDLYWSCREAFLVSSDLALRAQLTEFLDHKLVKLKRSIDGSELLTIPIDATLLHQFLDEQNHHNGQDK